MGRIIDALGFVLSNYRLLLPSSAGQRNQTLAHNGSNQLVWKNLDEQHPGYIIGRKYPQTYLNFPSEAAPLNSGVFYSFPYYIAKDVTLDQIAINVTTASTAGNIRIGIYANSNGKPGARIVDGGTVSTTTTGEKTVTFNQPLNYGWVHIVLHASEAIQCAGSWNARCAVLANLIGASSATAEDFGPMIAFGDYTAGLPATAPDVNGISASIPAIYLRFATAGALPADQTNLSVKTLKVKEVAVTSQALTAGQTLTLNVFNADLPIGSLIKELVVQVPNDTSTAATLQIGQTGELARYMAITDINLAVADNYRVIPYRKNTNSSVIATLNNPSGTSTTVTFTIFVVYA